MAIPHHECRTAAQTDVRHRRIPLIVRCYPNPVFQDCDSIFAFFYRKYTEVSYFGGIKHGILLHIVGFYDKINNVY